MAIKPLENEGPALLAIINGEPGGQTLTDEEKAAALAGGTGGAGADGLSAYEVAIANGFTGTEAEWLASLVGAQGPQGIQGPAGADGAQGPQGVQGPIGPEGPTAASAYGLTLIDDADASAARTTLGLGTAATSAASAFATSTQGTLAASAVQPSAAAGNTLTAGAKIWNGTQAAYDAIATKDTNTLYFVTG